MNCEKRCKLFSWLLTLVIVFGINFGIAFGYEKEIKSLSASIAERVAKAGKKNIAVVDFTDLQGNVTELGRFIAEEFSVELAGADKGFEVVERTQLKTILKEHKLAVTDIIDPSTARKLGQIAGVDALITGTITPFGESVRLSVKILDTTTAKVIGAISGDIPKTKAIEELLVKSIGGPIIQESEESHLEQENSINTSGKSLKPGMKFVFKDREFRAKDTFLIKLISVEILKNNDLKADMIVQNESHQNIQLRLNDPERTAYLADQDGQTYKFKESYDILYNVYKEVPLGIPLRFSIIFSGVPPKTYGLNMVYKLCCVNYSSRDVTFLNVDLK